MQFTWDRLKQFLAYSSRSNRYDSPYVDAEFGDEIVVDGDLKKSEFDAWRAAHDLPYTTEQPTKMGWYWFKGKIKDRPSLIAKKNDSVEMIVQVDEIGVSEFSVMVAGSEWCFVGSDFDGEWAGPLEMPR